MPVRTRLENEFEKARKQGGGIQPESGMETYYKRFGTKVERNYLTSRIKQGGGRTAAKAIDIVRNRRSPSTIRDE